MSAFKRMLIATTVVLSGLLLLPFVALPSQAFSWQLFTGAYGSAPALGVNHATGAPGSYFAFTGFNFPAGQRVTIEVNDRPLGVITAAGDGSINFSLATGGATEGRYDVTASYSTDDGATESSATASFELDEDEPLRAQEGSGVVFFVPAGLASQNVYLPLIRR